MTVAKQPPPVYWFSVAGRRECVKALEVSGVGSLFTRCLLPSPADFMGAWGLAGVSMRWVGVTGVGAGLPAVQGPAGGRSAGKRRGGGGGDRG
jgi:hypothetical protein